MLILKCPGQLQFLEETLRKSLPATLPVMGGPGDPSAIPPFPALPVTGTLGTFPTPYCVGDGDPQVVPTWCPDPPH